MQKIILEAGRDYNEAVGRVTFEKQEAARTRMREVGLEVRQADITMKQAWAKSLPNIAKMRFEEINKAGIPGEVVYAYIKAL